MSKYDKLVLVESPAKAKTIKKYLGGGYEVKATLGHIIDLPKKLGVDVENDYKPEFEVIKGKKKVITELRKALPEKGTVYLAMDPDREGEAIAYHVADALKLKNFKRVTFNEITKSAVEEGIKKASEIDDKLVEAQFARRVLDRLVGYKLSGVLWKKMWYGLSAGRVQSVALRLIVERERRIRKFIPVEYWDIIAKVGDKNKFDAELKKINGKKAVVSTEDEKNKIKAGLEGEDLVVKEIGKKIVKKHAYPPFTTSTLQQAGNNLYGYSAKKIMSIAQKLYQAGNITYMRTDSVTLSKSAVESIRDHISKRIGKEYLPEKPNYYKQKSKLAQEAHEAIRPVDINATHESLKIVKPEEVKLYNLIRNRTIASQMSERVLESNNAVLEGAGKDNVKYTFTLSGSKVIFEGWSRVLPMKSQDDSQILDKLSDLKEGEKYKVNEIVGEQKFTKPVARYTEASLVKALEKYGVGRPSTYATIINTLLTRKYVFKDKKNLLPTDIGEVVCKFLEDNFERLVDYDYTAAVEDQFDKIAEGEVEYVPFMDAQYKPLLKEIENVDKVNKDDVLILNDSDSKCPKCGAEMKVKLGRYGKFLTCSKFPDCDGILNIDGKSDEEKTLELDTDKYEKAPDCPDCKGEMVLKEGRYGKFWACKDYPKCKGTAPLELKEKCPECGKNLLERKGKWGKTFIGCTGYPDCKYIKGSGKNGFKKSKSGSKSKSKRKSKSSSKSQSKKRSGVKKKSTK